MRKRRWDGKRWRYHYPPRPDNIQFLKSFTRWVEEHGIKYWFICEKTGVPYQSFISWKHKKQPLANRHLESLWIFTGKSIHPPRYRDKRYVWK